MRYEIECTCTTVYGWTRDPIGRVVDHRCGMHGRSAAARAKRLTFALVADGVNPAAAPLVEAALTGAFRARHMIDREAKAAVAASLFGMLDGALYG